MPPGFTRAQRKRAARPIRISPAGAAPRPTRRPDEYRFETIKPGVVPFSDGRAQAPHISVWIVARGINLGLHTRVYFSDEATANAADPVLNRIEHKSRVKSLIAERNGDTVTFDIHLQGPNETVFFDI